MNLTDLQVELRLIEEHIATLHSEIEKMKPQPEEKKKADFEQITTLASKYPIEKISIRKAPVEIKKLIFSSFSYILLQEEAGFYNRILYLCRLANGCGFNTTAENLYKMGLEFELRDLNKLCHKISEYKYTYLIEMIVMANISEEASENIFVMVTDFASAFDVSKEELRVLGLTAKGVLISNEDAILDMPVPSKNMWSGKLREYIDDEWIEKSRKRCGTLYTKRYMRGLFRGGLFGERMRYLNDEWRETTFCTINNCMQTGSLVRKGDIICSYTEQEPKKVESFFLYNTEQEPKEMEERTIIAPCNGVVFLVENKKIVGGDKLNEYIAIFVVSYFDDYSEFCTWYKKKFIS